MLSRVNRLAIAVGVTAASVLPATSHAAEVKLDLANEYSANSLVGLADQDFIARVSELSGGEIEITPHFGGALGFKSRDHFDAVGDGAVPIAGTYTGVFTGIDPVFALSAMPFLAPGVDDAARLFEIARPYYDRVFERANQKLLYASPYTPTGVWADRAIRDTADLENLRIRTYDAPGVETFKRVGAAPIQLSWADVIPQLTTGGIDAVLTSDESGISAKFWEHLSHFNAIPYSIAINMTHMNLDTYNSLTESQRVAIDKAAAATQARNWKRVEERVMRNAEILAEHDVVVVDAPAPLVEDLQKAAEAVLQQWLDDMGEDGEAILDAYRGE